MEVFQLDRFIKAQDSYNSYETALQEVKNGEKRSHWIWYIFPQIDGMGYSSTSKFYGIKSLQEAKAYFKNETLRNRLYEITNALLAQDGSARSIFGGLDAMKVRSCMTLFNLVSPNDVFAKVLYKFYDGEPCKRTLSILKDELEYREKNISLIEFIIMRYVHCTRQTRLALLSMMKSLYSEVILLAHTVVAQQELQ